MANPVPMKKASDFVPLLVRFVEEATARGLALEPARAFPLCVFDEQQLKFLREKANLQGTCLAINDITVNTDFSIQLCSVTHAISTPPAVGAEELREKVAYLEKEEKKLNSSPGLPECRDCSFLVSGECQGGCHAYRLFGREG